MVDGEVHVAFGVIVVTTNEGVGVEVTVTLVLAGQAGPAQVEPLGHEKHAAVAGSCEMITTGVAVYVALKVPLHDGSEHVELGGHVPQG